MDMMDASLTSGGVNPMGVLDKNREERMLDRVRAIEQGKKAAYSSGKEVDSKVRGVAEEFVSVFMNQVMKSMRATVQENPAMHGDNGEKFFQDLLDTEQSKNLAKGSGYGLTDLVYEALMAKSRAADAAAAKKQAAAETNEAVELL